MRRLRILSSANRDLQQTYLYIVRESGSRQVGRRFIALLRQQCRKLADLPGLMGRERPEVTPGLRSFAYRGYVIFFRYNDDCLEVVNILEGHRDIVAYFDRFSSDDE